MRRAFGGRSIVLAGAMGSSWTEHIEMLRSVGVSKLLVVATEGRGAGPLPDVPTLIVEPPAGLSQMERIHHADRTLHEPTAEMINAIELFDPQADAIVIGTFLSTASQVVGRPLVSYRRPEWLALEDKVVVDAFWDRAGVDRQPAIVVPLDEAAACRPVDRSGRRHGVGRRCPRGLPRRCHPDLLGDRRRVAPASGRGPAPGVRLSSGHAVPRGDPVLDPWHRAP